jgi:hypothetical protein
LRKHPVYRFLQSHHYGTMAQRVQKHEFLKALLKAVSKTSLS